MKYKIAVVQMRISTDAASNLQAGADWAVRAAREGAQILCLPELFRARYFCQAEDPERFALAENIPGETTAVLGRIANAHGIAIVAPLFERRAPGLYHNSAAVLDRDGSLADVYRKMHIPDDPGYYEKYYFAPGDMGFKAIHTSLGPLGVLICWDQWYPEGARLTSMQGAPVLFYPTAIGWHPHEPENLGQAQYEAWHTIQRSHAIANGVYVAVANRVGFEARSEAGMQALANPGHDGLNFWGGSFIADPFGRIVAQAGHEREELLMAELDEALVAKTRELWPFWRDRRVDAYGELTQRFGIGKRFTP